MSLTGRYQSLFTHTISRSSLAYVWRILKDPGNGAPTRQSKDPKFGLNWACTPNERSREGMQSRDQIILP